MNIKTKLVRTLVAALLFASLLTIPGMATIGGGAVTASALNLRTAASTQSAVRTVIPNGAFLIVEESLGDWYKVYYNNVEGFVYGLYVDFAETMDGEFSGAASISGDGVRLREGASAEASMLGVYYEGDRLTLRGVSGNWLKVEADDGKVGYVRSDFVRFGAVSQEASAQGEQIVETAKEYLGTPYVWAGMSPSGFDCSGFVNYVYNQHDYSLNRTAQSIYSNNGEHVSKEELQAGDIICFGYSGSNITHVGIYIGDGQFIHSSSGSSMSVVITDLSENYYTRMYIGAKRIID